MLGPELGWMVRPIFMQSQVRLPLPSSQNWKPETALSLSLSLSLCGFRMGRNETVPFLVLLLSLSLPWISLAYRPGDLVPMSKMGQYHSVRTLKPSLSLSLSLSLMHIILNFRINLSIFKIFNNFSPELCGTI